MIQSCILVTAHMNILVHFLSLLLHRPPSLHLSFYTFLCSFYTRVIRKITSGVLLTKQAITKDYYVPKNTYILVFKTFLSAVTPELRHLYRGISFCMPVSKKSAACELSPLFDDFHQLFIILETLWSQQVLQVGKQVVVARSEIRAVRRGLNNSQLKSIATRMTQAYKNLVPDTSTSIPAVTMLRSTVSTCTYFLYKINFVSYCFVNGSTEVTFRIKYKKVKK
jgi:hypothetical protein